MPGATFWVLAISALALIGFVSGPVAEEYPLAVVGILAFMLVQASLPACRIRTPTPVCPANIAQGYYWIQLVLVTVLVGYFGFSQGVLPHLPSKSAINLAIGVHVVSYLSFCDGLLIHPTVTGRAEWFRRNPYDPAFVRAEDRELWIRTGATTRVARLCEPLFFYREGPAGNLGNYLRTERTVRAILRRYGPPLVGMRQTRLLVMRSRLKSMTYRVGTGLGLQGRLISRRNRRLEVAEIREASRILAAIQVTPVSGLEEGVPGPAAGRALPGVAAA